jgi:hypothetical protein
MTITPGIKKDPVFRMLCSLKYQAVDKVQQFSNLGCYTPLIEPFKIEQISYIKELQFIQLIYY